MEDKLNPDGSTQDGCLPLLIAGVILTLLLALAPVVQAAPPQQPATKTVRGCVICLPLMPCSVVTNLNVCRKLHRPIQYLRSAASAPAPLCAVERAG